MASSRGRWASPERTMVWTEPPKTTPRPNKVAVVYYLCRNGHLEHPHFMEVALSSPAQGLYLRDVMARLDMLRGNGMANLYSWSSKRTYKHGYVWHDLTDHDLIHPAHGNEYVLKGSELLLLPPSSDASTRAARRKNWSSFDLAEYKVAVRTAPELSAATQTDDRRRKQEAAEPTTELGIDEISPPPSSSSPETLETLIKNDARVAAAVAAQREQQVVFSSRDVGVITGGRMRASAMLMQLISCGSITVKDGTASGPGARARYTDRLPRARSDLSAGNKEVEGSGTEVEGLSGCMVGANAMDREYFSGSLIETKTTSDHAGDLPALALFRRSSSYNADRGVKAMNKLELQAAAAAAEEEGIGDVRRARCIPAARKPKSTARRPPSHGAASVPSGAAAI